MDERPVGCLPAWFTRWLADRLIGKLQRGELKPHKYGNITAPDGSTYMERGWLFEPSWWTLGWGARVHHTAQSDRDRHLHDHPWDNISVILRGSYFEHTPVCEFPAYLDRRELTVVALREAGDVIFRRAHERHRLEVGSSGGCYSLFLVGPWKQMWGFYTSNGKVPWRRYLGLPDAPPHERYL